MRVSRLLPKMSLIAVVCLLAVQAQAATQTGSFSFDGQTVHYLVFTGNDESFFQSFAAGGTLTNFESVPGVTPFTASTFDNKTVDASNFVSPQTPINGIYYSGGGQTPGDPVGSSNAFKTVLVNLNGIPGAHSGTHVLAPSDFDGTDVKFSGGFFSFGVQTESPGSLSNALSRIGWWTNPSSTTGATTPNIHVVDSLGGKTDNFLVNSGITTAKVQPGDFFAVAFDRPIIQEVEFVPVDHATIDDVVFARDNKVAFAVVPEPSSWLLLAAGMGLLLLARGRNWKS